MEFDSKRWLLAFLAESKREAARLRKNADWPAHLPKRSKPWPRATGLKTASGLPALFRV
jgi:hypothetical protein